MAKLKIIVEVDAEPEYHDPEGIAEDVLDARYIDDTDILLAEWIEDWRVGGRPEGKLPPPRRPVRDYTGPAKIPPMRTPPPRAAVEPVSSPQVAGLLRRVLEHLDAGIPLAHELEQAVKNAETALTRERQEEREWDRDY